MPDDTHANKKTQAKTNRNRFFFFRPTDQDYFSKRKKMHFVCSCKIFLVNDFIRKGFRSSFVKHKGAVGMTCDAAEYDRDFFFGIKGGTAENKTGRCRHFALALPKIRRACCRKNGVAEHEGGVLPKKRCCRKNGVAQKKVLPKKWCCRKSGVAEKIMLSKTCVSQIRPPKIWKWRCRKLKTTWFTLWNWWKHLNPRFRQTHSAALSATIFGQHRPNSFGSAAPKIKRSRHIPVSPFPLPPRPFLPFHFRWSPSPLKTFFLKTHVLYAYMLAYLHICEHICIYVGISACMLAYMYICGHICIYVSTYAYMRAYTHMC